MKAVILYRPNSEHARAAENFVTEFKRRTNKKIQVIDVDSVEGIRMVEVFDIPQYPAVVVTQEDGSYLKHWGGEPLPLINDVAGYLVQR